MTFYFIFPLVFEISVILLDFSSEIACVFTFFGLEIWAIRSTTFFFWGDHTWDRRWGWGWHAWVDRWGWGERLVVDTGQGLSCCWSAGQGAICGQFCQAAPHHLFPPSLGWGLLPLDLQTAVRTSHRSDHLLKFLFIIVLKNHNYLVLSTLKF